MDKKTKHPEIEVELLGQDGNAFFILEKVRKALSRAGFGEEVKQFTDEATSGDYDNLLVVVMDWVTITGPKSSTIDEEDLYTLSDEELRVDKVEDELPF